MMTGWRCWAGKRRAAAGLQAVEPLPSPAGEDFAFYQKEVPGLFAFLGTSGPHEWHHPSFDADERGLPLAAGFLAELAERALKLYETRDGEEREHPFSEKQTLQREE